MLSPETIREALLACWGRQACQHSRDWPDALARLLRDGTASPGGSGYGRASLRPAVDEATAALALAFANGPPFDPVDCVWRSFPRLDHQRREELAQQLMEASHG